jgi:hypothetical protein
LHARLTIERAEESGFFGLASAVRELEEKLR